MKNKLKKLTAVITAITISASLTACGKDDDSGKKAEKKEKGGTYTLSEYINSDETLILYENKDGFPQNDKIHGTFVFDDGKLTYYGADNDTALTCGELSEMTDKEIIETLKEKYEVYGENLSFETGIYTDDTGNSIEAEYIKPENRTIDDNKESENSPTIYLFPYQNTTTLYDSQYTGIMCENNYDSIQKKYLWYRSNDLTIELDTPKSKGIEIDP